MPARYGQSNYQNAGTPITLAADGHFFAQVRLQRPALVSGSVWDENGVGLSSLSVSAYRIGIRPKLVAAATTDERGSYRFPNLGPGKYIVRTGATLLEGGLALQPTFHGGTTSAAQARAIDVALDSEHSGIDITPLPGHLSKLSGRVNAPGVLAVQLLGDLGMQEAPVQSGGAFEFRAIPDGSYTLVAAAAVSTGVTIPLSAAERVVINGEDRTVGLALGPSPEVILECKRNQVANALALFLDRDGYDDGQQRRLNCGEKLRIPDGAWNARVMPLSGAFVETLGWLSEGGCRNDSWPVWAGTGEGLTFTATIGASAARVAGEVRANSRPAAGVPVGLVAVSDDLLRRMGGARLTRTDASGKFRFDGLAPGDYRLMSSAELESVASIDGAKAQGKTVALRPLQEMEIELEWEN